MPLPTPSEQHGPVPITLQRLEDKKIERLLAILAQKIARANQHGRRSKKIA